MKHRPQLKFADRVAVELKAFYFGTPVVVVSSLNPDGSTNLAPMSSAWWLGQDAMIGMANAAQTVANLRRHGACVLNLMSVDLAPEVDRLALLTGRRDLPAPKAAIGYRFEPDKFAAAGLTPQQSELVEPARVAESRIQLEGEVVSQHRFESSDGTEATAFQVRTLRTHLDPSLIFEGTRHVDPNRWQPLIMKFCEFYGDGAAVASSRLGRAWSLPPATVRR